MPEEPGLPPRWEPADSEVLLRAAFASCARVFPEAELDPLDWWLEEFRATREGRHPGSYTCLILRDGVAVGGGITWNLYSRPEGLIGAIGFLWIEEGSGLRGRGLARRGFEKARELMRETARERGLPLLFILLEANRPDSHLDLGDSSAFWSRRGFRAVEGIDYRLPCLSFDAASGRPALPDISLVLMLRPEAEAEPTASPAFVSRVKMIYLDWYAPSPGEFSTPLGYEAALRHVEGAFAASFSGFGGEGRGPGGRGGSAFRDRSG